MKPLGPEERLADRFELVEPIGHGVLGRTWKAHAPWKCPVAVKVLNGNYAESRTCRRCFLDGARKMAELRHSGIVRVFEVHGAETHGHCFYVMELAESGNLRRSRARELPAHKKLRVIFDVGWALEFAHNERVVHRCLNPTNVLLTSGGRAVVSDFDLARVRDHGDGSMAIILPDIVYVAPEVTRATDAGILADVYSLGMIALFLWHDTGLSERVRNGNAPEDVARRLPIPEEARDAIVRAVERDPDSRWDSIGGFCDALDTAFENWKPPSKRRGSWNTPTERWRMCDWLRPQLSEEMGELQPSWTAEQRADSVAAALRTIEDLLAQCMGKRPSPDGLQSLARSVMKSQIPARPLAPGPAALDPGFRQCFEQLDDPERRVVTLCRHLGTEPGDAARILGWTVQETKARLERGLRQFHECLETHRGDKSSTEGE